MGQIAFNSGIAKKFFDAAHRFIGHIPGGLAIATVVGATIFKAICGSSPATAATFASVAVPEMDRYGYDKRLSTGIVATVGTLGVLIPPSVTLIVFGVITEQSIGRLFMAGLIPGLMISLFLYLHHYRVGQDEPGHRTQKREVHLGCKDAVASRGLLAGPDLPRRHRRAFKRVFHALRGREHRVLGSHCPGTPEAEPSGGRRFVKSVDESLRTACMVIMLIAGSAVLGHFIAVTNIPMLAADWIAALPLPRWIIMIVISIFYLFGGSFIDDLAFMILATPIFYPAIIKLGYDPMWFGMIIAITVMVGVVIPPVAINVFVVKNITKTPFSVIYAGVYPFLLSLCICGMLLFHFPTICTFLPNLLYK